MKDNTIGQKIRTYRTRAKMSQLELELAIGAASGSISRIENGDTNPTKETLLSIIDALRLTTYEAADLFGINVIENHLSTGELYRDFFEVTKTLLQIEDKNLLLQKSVDLILEYLDINAAAIFLVDKKNNRLIPGKVASTPILTKALMILPKKFEEYTVTLNQTENYVVKSVMQNNIVTSTSEHDFLRPTVHPSISRAMQKFLGIEEMAAIPVSKNDNCIASIMLSSTKKGYISQIREVLLTYAKILYLSISEMQYK